MHHDDVAGVRAHMHPPPSRLLPLLDRKRCQDHEGHVPRGEGGGYEPEEGGEAGVEGEGRVIRHHDVFLRRLHRDQRRDTHVPVQGYDPLHLGESGVYAIFFFAGSRIGDEMLYSLSSSLKLRPK